VLFGGRSRRGPGGGPWWVRRGRRRWSTTAIAVACAAALVLVECVVPLAAVAAQGDGSRSAASAPGAPSSGCPPAVTLASDQPPGLGEEGEDDLIKGLLSLLAQSAGKAIGGQVAGWVIASLTGGGDKTPQEIAELQRQINDQQKRLDQLTNKVDQLQQDIDQFEQAYWTESKRMEYANAVRLLTDDIGTFRSYNKELEWLAEQKGWLSAHP
jgi:hypothetical protein